MTVDSVKEYYEKPERWKWIINSFVYKNYFKKQESKILSLILELIPEPENKKLLDAGCGYGRFTKKFYDMDFSVYAVDLSENMIKNVKEFCIDFEIGDLTSTKFEDNFFDIVTSIEVFDHLESPELAIKEFKRVLDKDGVLLVTIFNRKSIFYYAHRILRVIFKIIKFNIGTPISKAYTEKELQKMLDGHFEEYKIIPLHHIFPTPLQYVGIAKRKINK